ncbi:GTPase IMAP family member 4 isoform X3 [Micropterus dolomieu]|uniref:GTPase IMAP family member 4 isoform X3 n=1 Tax=Micropterus dolomieu TaxID=147949 RepID=UPI001E8EE31E|nr:GTPase IMAP family member 4 isoform X3 [Micropterus dolomieu]
MDASKPLQAAAGDASGSEEEAKKAAAAAAKVANRLPEVRLVMLGWRWPGKSLTGNTIIGREEFRLERAAEFCVKRQAEVLERQVTVVDTPGWFSAQDTPPSYKDEIVRGASLCPPGPHAFLLVIPVGMFTEVDRARIEEHVSLFGERVWKHTIVVFSWAEVLRTISIERWDTCWREWRRWWQRRVATTVWRRWRKRRNLWMRTRIQPGRCGSWGHGPNRTRGWLCPKPWRWSRFPINKTLMADGPTKPRRTEPPP